MVTHDEQIGQMLDKLDELGIADNTIVMYSTDNGPENDTWPDAANTPFRSQKDTNWEGALARSGILPLARQDQGGLGPERHRLSPGHAADIAGRGGRSEHQPETLERLQGWGQDLQGAYRRRQHVPYLTGEVKESPRNHFFYVSDDGGIMAVRAGDWKLVFEEQRATTMQVWAEPLVKLRVPHIFNLRRDPFERADFNSNTYWDWMVDHVPHAVRMSGSWWRRRSRTSSSTRRARRRPRSTWTRCIAAIARMRSKRR